MESRMELGLRKILGESVKVPEPMSRAEELLAQIAEKGIGSGGGATSGKGIQKIEKTNTEDLVDTYTITYTDASTTTFTVTNGKNGSDGSPGQDGEDGYSPTIVENAENSDSVYKLDIATKTGTLTTPNLKGADGTDGSGTSDYADLTNKPKINNVEVSGDKTLADYNIQASSDNNLSTTDKTVVGAINELYSMITSVSQKVDEINGKVM